MKVSRHKGFTLVELMVAMAVGSLVILGAGQLFITTINTFQKVKEINRKQEAVVFATHTLTSTYRQRKNLREYDFALTDGYNPENCAIKRISDDGEEILIEGLYKDSECSDGDFKRDKDIHGFREFTLGFARDNSSEYKEEITFHVMERFPGIEGYVLLAGENISISGVSNLSGRVHAEGDVIGRDRSDEITSAAEGDPNIFIPKPNDFISQIANSEDESVMQYPSSCNLGSISSKVVYCPSGVIGKFSDLSSNVKIIVTGGSLAPPSNDNIDVSLVVAGAVNITGNIKFSGLMWVGGDFVFQGDGNNSIEGRIISSGSTATNDGDLSLKDIANIEYADISDFFDTIDTLEDVSQPALP